MEQKPLGRGGCVDALFEHDRCASRGFALEKAVEAADLAIQVFSGYRYVGEYPARKYMRDTWVMTLHEDTGQLRKLLIGRAETGVSAFP